MWFWLWTTVLSLLLSSIYPKLYIQNIWEDFINISCVWKRTQENFCDQHTLLGTKMPRSPLPVTWMLWPTESVPALTENMCRCSQDGVTALVSSGWGTWNKEAKILMTPGEWAWGIPVTALAPVPELMTRHRHFSKGKFIKPWTGEAGNGGSDQRAGGHAMCHLPCSLMFSKILCYYAALCVCVLQYT